MSFAVSRRASTASCRQAACLPSRRVVSVRAENPSSTPNGVKPAAAPTVTGTASSPMPATSVPPAPAPVTQAPSLQSAMGFSGPAPETINGRLAMLGFVAAAGAELASGNTLIAQLDASVIPVLATFFVFSAASLIPIVKGANLTEAFGPFKPEAEMLNGRLAMLGLVALIVTEGVKGSALF